MQQKYYLDTSIWIDYLEDRKDRIRPLGEFAFQFLKKCKKEKAKIIVLDIVLKELRKQMPEEKIQTMLSDFYDLIVKLKHTEKQFNEADNLWEKNNKEFPLADILHSIIAKDENAILMSRDKHFNEIGIAKEYLPEELI